MAWRTIAAKLVAKIPVDAIEVRAFRNDSVKIQCVNADMFRIIQKHLKNSQTDFSTFPKPEEKTLKIVIRGLTKDISEN